MTDPLPLGSLLYWSDLCHASYRGTFAGLLLDERPKVAKNTVVTMNLGWPTSHAPVTKILEIDERTDTAKISFISSDLLTLKEKI